MNAKEALKAIKNGATVEISGKRNTPARWTIKNGVIFTQSNFIDTRFYYARFDETQASTKAHFERMQADGLKIEAVNGDDFRTAPDCYIKRGKPTKKQLEKLEAVKEATA